MIKPILKNSFIFISLLIIQIFILDNIRLSGFLNPYLYVLFILLLPFETPSWMLILLSFLLGLCMDLFTNGIVGINAAASVFIGFLRPYVIKIISAREDIVPGTLPRIAYYGFNWFLKYSLVLIFAHHFLLFFLETFTFSDFFVVFLKIKLLL